MKSRSLTFLIVLLTLTEPTRVAPQEIPAFRAGVRAIEVDVRVTDERGQAVRDLTAKDFTIFDNDVAQSLSSFAAVTLGDARSAAVSSERAPVGDLTNNDGPGRIWVMLIGGFGQKARLAARTFIENAVGPRDDVAVVQVHGTMSGSQGFTRDRRLLLDAIDRVGESAANVGMNADVVGYRVLTDVCNRLGGFNGRPKAVVYFDPPAYFQPPPRATPEELAPYLDQLDAMRAATRNNVAVYVVSTLGLTTEIQNPLDVLPRQSPLQKMAGQRVLAEDTGGDAIINSNDYASGFKRFAQTTSAYYLLGYTPTEEPNTTLSSSEWRVSTKAVEHV